MEDFTLEGIVHSKPSRVVKGRKDPSQTYEFKSLVLEVRTVSEIPIVKDGEPKKGYVTNNKLHKLDVGRWVNIGDFEVKDPVKVRFILDSRQFVNKDGENDIMTKPIVVAMEFATIQGEKPRAKPVEDFPPPPAQDELNDDLPF